MPKTLKKLSQREIEELWLQAFELKESLHELSDDELREVRDDLQLRAEAILSILHNAVKDDMSEEEAMDPGDVIINIKLAKGV